MKNNLKICTLIFVLIILLIFPGPIIAATKAGILTWADKVIPSLFPFLVLTQLMIHYQVPQLIGKLLAPIFKYLLHISPITFFIMLMGLISGNPSGAKMARDYYDQKLISKQEFKGLLYFCNFSSPLFIIGTIGVVLYESSKIGYFLLASHLIGSLAVFICCYPYLKNKQGENQVNIKVPTHPFSAILIDAIENSIQTLIRVGGIIMFFYIISAALNIIQLIDLLNILLAPLLSALNIGNIEPLFSGILEFTQGVTKIASADLPFYIQLTLTAFIVSFAGLSVHTQVFMFANGVGLSYSKFLSFRILHGWASALIVLFSWQWFFSGSQDVFAPTTSADSPTLSLMIPITIGIFGFYFLLKLIIYSKSTIYKKFKTTG